MKMSTRSHAPVNSSGIRFDHYAELVAQRLWRRLGDTCSIDLRAVQASWQAGTTIRKCTEELVDAAWDEMAVSTR